MEGTAREKAGETLTVFIYETERQLCVKSVAKERMTEEEGPRESR